MSKKRNAARGVDDLIREVDQKISSTNKITPDKEPVKIDIEQVGETLTKSEERAPQGFIEGFNLVNIQEVINSNNEPDEEYFEMPLPVDENINVDSRIRALELAIQVITDQSKQNFENAQASWVYETEMRKKYTPYNKDPIQNKLEAKHPTANDIVLSAKLFLEFIEGR